MTQHFRPKRSRRASSQTLEIVGVNSTDRVGLFKLKVFQESGDVQPHQMKLYYNGTEMEDMNTLESYGLRVSASSPEQLPVLIPGGRPSLLFT